MLAACLVRRDSRNPNLPQQRTTKMQPNLFYSPPNCYVRGLGSSEGSSLRAQGQEARCKGRTQTSICRTGFTHAETKMYDEVAARFPYTLSSLKTTAAGQAGIPPNSRSTAPSVAEYVSCAETKSLDVCTFHCVTAYRPRRSTDTRKCCCRSLHHFVLSTRGLEFSRSSVANTLIPERLTLSQGPSWTRPG